MTDTGRRHGDDQSTALDAMLRTVGPRVSFPPAPDLWPAIEHELRTKPKVETRAVGTEWLPRPNFVRVIVSAIIVLLVLVAALVVFPDLRQAVADRFGLTGVVLRFVDEPPVAPAAPVGTTLNLGKLVTIEQAAQATGFSLQEPAAADLGAPGAVYLTFGQSNPMVSFVYAASDVLPASRYSGVGALLTQFRGTTQRGMITKGIMADSAVTATLVNGAPGYWIDGAAHFFMYEDPAGEYQSEEFRLAGNVLLWEVDGITYRLESELTQDAAVAIAESMRPIDFEGTD